MTSTLLQLLLTGGGGAILLAIINAVLNRKQGRAIADKTDAEGEQVRAQAMQALLESASGGAKELLDSMRADVAAARQETREARAESAELRKEIETIRDMVRTLQDENHTLRRERDEATRELAAAKGGRRMGEIRVIPPTTEGGDTAT